MCAAGRVDVRVGTMVRDWVMQHELVLTDRRKRRMANVQVRNHQPTDSYYRVLGLLRLGKALFVC